MTPMIATKRQRQPRERRIAGGRVSCQPRISASAGNIGRMYEGSLEPDTLKNTKMNADQTTANRCQLKPLRPTGASVHMRRAVHRNTVSQGRMPTTKMGMKYHHAPSRVCFVGQKAREMLADEEEIEELAVAQGHGDEPRRGDRQKTSEPPIRCSRAPQRPVAPEQGVDRPVAAPGSTTPISPLDSTASASAAHAAQHPATLLRGRRVVALGDEQAAEADAHPERDAGVEREDMGVQDVPRAAAEHRARCTAPSSGPPRRRPT